MVFLFFTHGVAYLLTIDRVISVKSERGPASCQTTVSAAAALAANIGDSLLDGARRLFQSRRVMLLPPPLLLQLLMGMMDAANAILTSHRLPQYQQRIGFRRTTLPVVALAYTLMLTRCETRFFYN